MRLKITRRKFFNRAIMTLVALPACLLFSKQKFAYSEATELQPVDEGNPTAQALGYKHDIADVDLVRFPKRAGDEGAKQFCDNCVFWTEGGLSVEGSDKEWGKCTIFPGAVVAAKGWCNTWALKPGA